MTAAAIFWEEARRDLIQKALAGHNRIIDARAKPLAAAMEQWLQRFARLVLERELQRGLRKADDEERLRQELQALIRMFGMRQLTDAAQGVAGGVLVPDSAITDFLATKEVQIAGLMADTREGVRDVVRATLTAAQLEMPEPSVGTIARRLRESFAANEDRPFIVSPERAALIARTELVQAVNTGIFEGYRATGVEELEWLSYSDGASGDRHHERMNGQVIRLGEYFRTPLGNRLRYPGDPAGPIKETANCRCTPAPKRRTA